MKVLGQFVFFSFTAQVHNNADDSTDIVLFDPVLATYGL